MMRCIYWFKDCHYSDKRIKIPSELANLFDTYNREQYDGDYYQHIPYDVCEECMKHSADDYGRNTKDYSTVLSKSGIFPYRRKIAENILDNITHDDIDDKLSYLIKFMKIIKEKERAISIEHHKLINQLKNGEMAIKRILEQKEGY